MNPFKQPLERFKADLDRKIAQYFDAEIEEQINPELKQAFDHLKNYILAGGKRLRPYIFNLMKTEFGKTEEIEDILIAFEFLHNSTLIDDDIIDEHDARRGRPTLPSVYKDRTYNKDFAALLCGNILRGKGLDLIISSALPWDFKQECLCAYQEIGKNIDLAQILDLEYRNKTDLSKQDYLAQTDLVAARFIAYMFALCTPEKYKPQFFEVGRNMGIAFQLADDLMDIDATKQKGRLLGSDIREGTPTLLSIYAFGRLDRTDQDKFKELFGKKDLSAEELQWIILQYDKCAAIKDSKDKVIEYVNKANRILKKLRVPKDHWTFAFGEYSLQRSH